MRSPVEVREPILFLIPARGGSRRIPDKNLRTVAGIPLVGWAVRTARAAAARLPGAEHAVVCSTDDAAIADASRVWGAETPFVRPARLADDSASSVDVALHAIDTLAEQDRRFAIVALVQPTSPLTDPHDLVAAIEAFLAGGRAGVVAVTHSHPADWHLGRVAGETADDLLLTGAFFVVDVDQLRASRTFVIPGVTRGSVIPPERAIDIDEPHDLVMAEAMSRARPMRELVLADHPIDGRSAFIIAEAGVNHDGRLAVAHRLIEAAAEAGADAIKFQTFDPAALAMSGAPLAAYQSASQPPGEDQRSMLARLSLAETDWPELQAHAVALGLVFLSTPFDVGSADLLDRLDVPAFKVGSGELTNHPFLRRLAGYGRPMLISTGMADMIEVARALDVVAGAGDPPIGLFHCVSAYPADPADADLRAISTMRNAFRVPTGWSDHSLGIELPIAAAALGADLIEKHLTLDVTARGPDHRASLEPAVFRTMVTAVRQVTVALGDGQKIPSEGERDVARVARRSLVWGRSLETGRSITDDDLVALRPGTGISPARLADLVGQVTARPVVEGRLVDPADVRS